LAFLHRRYSTILSALKKIVVYKQLYKSRFTLLCNYRQQVMNTYNLNRQQI